jgi:hypothetical protein
MKRIILIVVIAVSFNCCGVKSSGEEDRKSISDLQARIVMKDSVISAYKDSLRDCREDNLQLEHWLRRQ